MTAPEASWAALVHRRHLAHTSILMLSIVIYVGDSFMVAAILPSVVEEIGGVAFYTWSAMLYTVCSTLGTACGGFLAGTYGMRRSAGAGVLLVVMGNASSAVAPSMTAFLVSRAVEGVGGGVLVGQAYGVASAFYPEPLRPRVLAMISVAHGVGALVGPVVGGAFATMRWWRGALWVTLPFLLVLVALIARFLPPREATGQVAHLPLFRLLLLGAAVLCVGVSGQVGSLTLRLLAVGVAAVFVSLTVRLDGRSPDRPHSRGDRHPVSPVDRVPVTARASPSTTSAPPRAVKIRCSMGCPAERFTFRLCKNLPCTYAVFFVIRL